jgi:inhibitor of KinA sporulation pathway (predicted exonuclease)
MTTTVNEATKLTLIDGSEIVVRPLKISLLRDFMKKFDDIAKVADDNNKSMTVLMECVQIAMKQYKPELSEDLKLLEEALDLPTVYAIIEAASGINLGASSLLSPATS